MVEENVVTRFCVVWIGTILLMGIIIDIGQNIVIKAACVLYI